MLYRNRRRKLSCPVKERYNLSTRACGIRTECTVVHTGGDAICKCPVNGSGVVGVAADVKESAVTSCGLTVLPPGIFLLCGRQLQRPCRASGLTVSELRTIIMQKFQNESAGFMKENRKLLKEVLKDIEHDMTDEEVLNLLADSKISESPTVEKYTLGQRAADAIAKFAGSWAFIFSFTSVLLLWMVVNTILSLNAEKICDIVCSTKPNCRR